MPRVDRFREAEEDLLSIAEYIAHDKLIAAARWVDDIEASFLSLARNPLLGEAVEHIRPRLRRLTIGKYVIYYEPRDCEIILIRVLHGTRRIEDLFRS
jgi:toxin ParE1/3/4